MMLALFKLAETMVGCLNSGENTIVIVSRIFVLLCFKTMLQKRVIHSTSATKHYRNPTLPKIQIPLPCPRLFTHIFTRLAQHCVLLSFLTSHALWRIWVNSPVCGLGQWDDQKLWYFVHACQFGRFFQAPGNKTRVLEALLQIIWK